ncbi:hypothetical protein D6C85_03271 [Aureobasidium pullulans]|uniref:Uncharacterized protein n=1 Tax=Aureobasidium pullulans TaxID=5580 RepID=A0A4S9X798_AURPU|nr:hypothetical protein D6C85_03271 [Aureobasidium pullulans]
MCKRTWFGCGAHVPSVMDSIPKNEWCDCDPKTEKNGTEYPPMGSMTGVEKAMAGY